MQTIFCVLNDVFIFVVLGVYCIATGSIIATNIPSFAAGMDVWKGARQWALTSPVDKLLMREPEQLGDGILEFTAFKGIFDMGLERVR